MPARFWSTYSKTWLTWSHRDEPSWAFSLNGQFVFMFWIYTSNNVLYHWKKDRQNGLQIYKVMLFFYIRVFLVFGNKLFLFCFLIIRMFSLEKIACCFCCISSCGATRCDICSGPACFIQVFDPFSWLKIAFFRWPVLLPSPWVSRFKSGNTGKGCLCTLNNTVGKSHSLKAAPRLQSRPHWCWKPNWNQVFNQLGDGDS